MREAFFIPLIVIAIISLMIIFEMNNRFKLRQQIKNDWGKFPTNQRKDSEKSLRAASFLNDEANFIVDDLTWYDLNLFDVFQRINLTYSSIGSESLYQTLRSYSLETNTTHHEKLEELITFFNENPLEREVVSYQFARLGKKDFNYAKAYLEQQVTSPFNHHYLFVFLGLLPLLGFFSAIFVGPLGLFVGIGALCFNTIFYLVKKGKLETELATMSYLVQGISLSVILSKKELPIKKELKKATHSLKSLLKFASSFRVKTGSETEIMFEMFSASFLIPFISYGTVSRKLKNNATEAKKVWHLLGNLEVAIAILNLRQIYGNNWCLPRFSSSGVTGENVIHPLLNEPVPNPVNWKQSTLVTGSNASGKSTYVKSVAINCLLAQTIHTCLATSFSLRPGYVLSSMGVEDNIIEGDSYFIAELKSLKRLVEQVKKHDFCYCFVDEILKGTNTIERISASSSMIRWLTKQNQLAFVATHDIELPQILAKECENIHFEETVSETEGISFDYQVKDGVATSRNAIKLIETMGFPNEIIKNSFEEAAYFDQNGAWCSKK
ncbi:DNA mismatch repair protein MutS [Vagococcus carniphilus]|uniref:MutS-related protein n=1 Tax=Vagococcus carniphilus TaxID=218144 RepID=UPI002891B6F2|nr:DNA mismatch repair protein MutS [Vagococcus carniphilus]MDT2848897.1 DNA mismatch repair protein MutS [Vagococcus carniphilus]